MKYPVTYREYQENLSQGEFMGLKCKKCGTILFPPMAVCRDCGGSELGPVSLSGEGRLRTFTVVRVAPEGREPPYIVAMVKLEEGPFVIGNLVDVEADEITMAFMGQKVRLSSRLVEGDLYSAGDARVLTFSLVE